MVDASHVKAHQDATRSPLYLHAQKLGKTKGGQNTKLSACVNLAGRAVKIVLVPGNEHDSKSFNESLPHDIQHCFVLADKGYDSDAIRSDPDQKGTFTVIPPNQTAGGQYLATNTWVNCVARSKTSSAEFYDIDE